MTATNKSGMCPDGWSLDSLTSYVTHKSGDSKIIKGKQSSVPDSDLVQGYSASGPDVWVKQAQYHGPGIVVSAVGARCGKTFLADGQWTAIANTHAILPRDGLDPKFFWYVTNREEWWVKSGTAQPFVKVKDTLERPFCLPPVNEQREIVRILEEQFSRLDAAAASIAAVRRKAEQFRRSLLNTAFTGGLTHRGARHMNTNLSEWESSSLLEACELYQPKTISKAEMSSDGAFPVYGANGVIGRHHEFNHESSEVLLACRGNVGTVNVSQPRSWINGNAMVCKPRDERRLSKDFLALALQAMDLRSAITGTAQLQITRSSLGPLRIQIPPLNEQREIVKILAEQFSHQIAILASADEVERKVGSLRRSLLHATFTGELTKEWREKNNG